MSSHKMKDKQYSHDWAMKAYHNELQKTFYYTLNHIANKYTSFVNKTPITNEKYSSLITESQERKKQLLNYLNSASNQNLVKNLNFEDLPSVPQSYEMSDDDMLDISSKFSELNDTDGIPVDQIGYQCFHSPAKDKELRKVLEPLKTSSCTEHFNDSCSKTVQLKTFDQYEKSEKSDLGSMGTKLKNNSNIQDIEKTSIVTRSQMKAIINRTTHERNSELAKMEVGASFISGSNQPTADSNKTSHKKKGGKLIPLKRQNTKYASSSGGNRKQINKLSQNSLKSVTPSTSSVNQPPKFNGPNVDVIGTNATKFEDINSKMENMRLQGKNIVTETELNTVETNSKVANIEICASQISGCELPLTDADKNDNERVPALLNASNSHIVQIYKSPSKSNKMLVLMEDLSIHIVSNLEKINSKFIYFHDLEYQNVELCNDKVSTHSQSSAFSSTEPPCISTIPVQGHISEKHTHSPISDMPPTSLIHSEELQSSISHVALNIPSPTKEPCSTISNSSKSPCKPKFQELMPQVAISRLPASKKDVSSKQKLISSSLMTRDSMNSHHPSAELSPLESATYLPLTENHSNQYSPSKKKPIQHSSQGCSTQVLTLPSSAKSQLEQALVLQESQYSKRNSTISNSSPTHCKTKIQQRMPQVAISRLPASKKDVSSKQKLISSSLMTRDSINSHHPSAELSPLESTTSLPLTEYYSNQYSPSKIERIQHPSKDCFTQASSLPLSARSQLEQVLDLRESRCSTRNSTISNSSPTPCKTKFQELMPQVAISRLPASKKDVSSKQKLISSLMARETINSHHPSAELSPLESATCLPLTENHSNQYSPSKKKPIQHSSQGCSTQVLTLPSSARSQLEQALVLQESQHSKRNSTISNSSPTHFKTKIQQLLPQVAISRLPASKKDVSSKQKLTSSSFMSKDSINSQHPSAELSPLESPCLSLTENHTNKYSPSKIEPIQYPSQKFSTQASVLSAISQLEQVLVSQESQFYCNPKQPTIRSQGVESKLSTVKSTHITIPTLKSLSSMKENNYGYLMGPIKISKLKPFTRNRKGGTKHKRYKKAALVDEKIQVSPLVHSKSDIELPHSFLNKSHSDEDIPSKIHEHDKSFIQQPLPHLSAATQLAHSTLEKEGLSKKCNNPSSAIYEEGTKKSFEGNLSKAAPLHCFSSKLESIMSIKANNELKSLEPTNFQSKKNQTQDCAYHNSNKKLVGRKSTDQKLNLTKTNPKKISKTLILSDTLQPKKMGEVSLRLSHESPYYQLESTETSDDARVLLCNSSWLGLNKIKSKVHQDSLKDKEDNQVEFTLALTQQNLDDTLNSIQKFSCTKRSSITQKSFKTQDRSQKSFKTQFRSNMMPPPTKIRKLLQMSKLLDKIHDKC